MRAILAIAAFVSAAFCGAAHAQQNVALRDWSNLCLATHGDPAAALARADAAGWRADDITAQSQMATGQFEAVAFRFSVDTMNRRHTLAVLTFRPETRAGAQVQNVQCIVSYPTGTGPLGEMETILGFPRSWFDQGSSVWALIEDGGPMRPVPDDPAVARPLFESNQTALVRVQTAQGLDIVMFERMRSP
ncbi:MAG: hypothetical protein NT015_14355 [Alphaproteobacteria bacterium]|nr:hypothetical protein [Alphaproteobacteria bacterium]